ncbi:MAG: hypothetical protein AB1679_36370, partial [Actinomycetota bacterium]
MELATQGNNYRQLAEEIGQVLQAAAETAEKMVEDARAQADRIRAGAEDDRRTAYAEGRRVLDEARMEADMIRAEAEWQAQEIISQARRQAAEQIAGADARLAELTEAENRVMDRLAGVGQVLTEALAALRDEGAGGATPAPSPAVEETAPPLPEADDEADGPSANVYFVEFPPAAAAAAPAPADSGPEGEIVLTDSSAS